MTPSFLLLWNFTLPFSVLLYYQKQEVAKKLDYPIFMAVSERGGKNKSGDYEYLIDEGGNLLEYYDGQPIIDQDLVNFDLGPDELKDASTLSDDKVCIAEAFVRFAQKHGFVFWRES